MAAGVGVALFPQGWLQAMATRSSVVALRSQPALPALRYTFQRRRDDSRALLRALKTLVDETGDFRKPHPLW